MLIEKTGLRLQVSAKALGPGPYYKIATDEYRCPDCQTTVAYCSPATEQYAEHYEPGFATTPHDKEVMLNG